MNDAVLRENLDDWRADCTSPVHDDDFRDLILMVEIMVADEYDRGYRDAKAGRP